MVRALDYQKKVKGVKENCGSIKKKEKEEVYLPAFLLGVFEGSGAPRSSWGGECLLGDLSLKIF